MALSDSGGTDKEDHLNSGSDLEVNLSDVFFNDSDEGPLESSQDPDTTMSSVTPKIFPLESPAPTVMAPTPVLQRNHIHPHLLF